MRRVRINDIRRSTLPLSIQDFIDEIAVHQPGQHTRSDPVGQPTGCTTGTTVSHKCHSYVEYVAAQQF
jgi:hypothetical protein